MKKALKYIVTVIDGLCMAAANSVPGVSGGTIALLMGFYDEMIGAVNDLIFKKGKRLKALIYILFLGLGWGGGMIGAAKLLELVVFPSATNTYALFSLFFGFVLASIPMMIYDERGVLIGKKLVNIYWLLIGAVIIVGLTVCARSFKLAGFDLAVFDLPRALLLVLIGALAVIAMLLPGISGSTVFLVFGVYEPIMGNAVPALLKFDLSSLPMICFLAVGAIAGGLGAVKGIRICLDKFRSQIIYAVIGMLIGSLYSIIVGPSMLKNAIPEITFDSFNWLFFAVGVLVIAALEGYKIWKGRKDNDRT